MSMAFVAADSNFALTEHCITARDEILRKERKRTMILRFDEHDWERIERDWTAFWNGALIRPMVWFTCYDPATKSLPEKREFVPQYGTDMSAEEIIAIETADLERRHFIGDEMPKFWLNFGAGSAAAYMGAGVDVSEETIWFEPPGQPLDAITISVDSESFWYQRIHSVLDAGLNLWNGAVQVGFSDIGGNLDILASLRGTNELLLDLYDHADLVEQLTLDVTHAWNNIYQGEVNKIQAICRGTSPWAPIWSKGTTYMLQSDFSYMISPTMFERFVLPDLVALCEIMDDPFYHLDGKGEIPHLDLLLSIEKLKGVQWIPGDGQPPADQWLDLLKRIRDAGKFCQVFVSSQGAKTIISELGGNGFIFAINDKNLTPEEAQQLYQELTV